MENRGLGESLLERLARSGPQGAVEAERIRRAGSSAEAEENGDRSGSPGEGLNQLAELAIKVETDLRPSAAFSEPVYSD